MWFGEILARWAAVGFVLLASVAPTYDVWQCAVAGVIGSATASAGCAWGMRQRSRTRLAPPRRGV